VSFAKCCYAEWHLQSVVMMSVVIPSVVMLNDVIMCRYAECHLQSVVMLSVVMLTVVMLSAEASFFSPPPLADFLC